MKIFLATAFVCLSLFSPTLAQQLSVADALAIKERAATGTFSARAEWHALSFYLQGVVEGAAGYQQTLAEQGKRPLFCPPKNKNYSMQDLFALLGKSVSADRNRAASLVILESYARQYPCKN